MLTLVSARQISLYLTNQFARSIALPLVHLQDPSVLIKPSALEASIAPKYPALEHLIATEVTVADGDE